MIPVTQPERGQTVLVRRSATMSLFNGLGVLGGLALDMVVAALFGLGRDTDGFFLAFTVPQFVMLVLQSSYVNGLVPVLTGLQEGDRDRSWTVFSRLLNLNGVLIGAISVAGWLLAGWISALISAGLPPAEQAEVTQLARILFLMLPPLALAEVMRAQLNALRRFAVPSASNVVRYAGALVTLVLTHRAWGIRALAYGYVVGAVVQMAFLGAAVALAGGRYRLTWSIADPDVRAAMGMLVTRAGGIGLRRSGLIIERFLASFLPAGSVTALSYGRRMSLSLYQVFANSVSTAILPSLSASARAGDAQAQRHDIRLGYRLLSLITWPAAALMAALSVPIVRALFERGAFDATDTALTAALLAIYVVNVPALALVQVLLAPLYAGRDAVTPTRHMAWMLGINIFLAWLFMRFLGVSGLAWAATVTAMLSLGRAYWILRRLGRLDLVGYTVRVLGASCAAGVAAWVAWRGLDRLLASDNLGSTFLAAVAAGALGGMLYVAIAWLLGLRELLHLRRLLPSRAG